MATPPAGTARIGARPDVPRADGGEHRLDPAAEGGPPPGTDVGRTRLLALLGHELRTPLNAIRGYAELLLQGARGPITEAQRSDLQRITQAERHLLRMANDVLALTSIESGRLVYRHGRVRVARAFDEALALVTPQARAKGVRLHAEPTTPDLVVRADGDKLRQVLVNLLSNAIKYTPTGGLVALYAAREGAAVGLHVRDTGRGIPPEMRERIFEPFVRLPDTGSAEPAPQGVGLGLAISRGLARGMGGELTVESAPGVGSTFRLLLPEARDEGA
jgi:signal transduction histidine kinase